MATTNSCRLTPRKTVDIIGTGNIGRAADRIFKGFGSKVIGYDLYPNEEANTLLEYKASIDDVIKEADVISLLVPATKVNHHSLMLKCSKSLSQMHILSTQHEEV